MRELVFEVILVEQRVDSVLDDRVLQDLVDVWSLVRVHVQHRSQHVAHSLAEMSREIGVLASDYLSSQLVETLGVEWRVQGAHLVQQHAQRPNVRLETVGFALNDFGTQVVRSAYHCFGLASGITEDSCDAKITQFDHVVFSQEQVLRLQVSV